MFLRKILIEGYLVRFLLPPRFPFVPRLGPLGDLLISSVFFHLALVVDDVLVVHLSKSRVKLGQA